ncbi:hypothetical protein IDM40_27560 [Nocardiopsis sp. HNM0947]|uniref:Uncharacterized protein n=1 Tax=Nocardiopsis coralli TaxID=2772213 RepID=A0ABR9PF10_9ACTN|nr:hypothetical protein [Nocardiopsis coralli]MBE3002425.1 hypothetical protein [Nocardiopsis coralli]
MSTTNDTEPDTCSTEHTSAARNQGWPVADSPATRPEATAAHRPSLG